MFTLTIARPVPTTIHKKGNQIAGVAFFSEPAEIGALREEEPKVRLVAGLTCYRVGENAIMLVVCVAQLTRPRETLAGASV